MTNNLRLWGSFALCLPLALMEGCSTADKPKPVVMQAVVEAPGKAVLTLTELDDGARVVVGTTQELRIDLPNSAWAVINNFEWSVAEQNPAVLNVIGSRFERNARINNPTEAGGTTVWRVKPQAAGTGSLKFALRRPHRLDPPIQTVSFEITVK
jgi:predicted secreted protein